MANANIIHHIGFKVLFLVGLGFLPKALLADEIAGRTKDDAESLHFLVRSESVRNAYTKVVERFFHGADVNALDSRGRTPLSVYLDADRRIGVRRDREIFEFLCIKGAKVTIPDKDGRLPIHYAAQSGNWRAIETLSKLGSPISPKDKKGLTPLHYAAMLPFCGKDSYLWEREVRKTVLTLFRLGADYNAKARIGGKDMSPMELLSIKPRPMETSCDKWMDHFFVIRALAAVQQSGKTFTSKDPAVVRMFNIPPKASLYVKIWANDLKTVRELLKKSPRLISYRWSMGYDDYLLPIHAAVWSGHTRIVSCLLENGASLSQKAFIGSFKSPHEFIEDIPMYLFLKKFDKGNRKE